MTQDFCDICGAVMGNHMYDNDSSGLRLPNVYRWTRGVGWQTVLSSRKFKHSCNSCREEIRMAMEETIKDIKSRDKERESE